MINLQIITKYDLNSDYYELNSYFYKIYDKANRS